MAHQLYRLLATATAACFIGTAAGATIESLFGPYLSPGAEIASATDANFSTVVGHRWSEWDPPIWTGAIKPATVPDIQAIVRIASSHNISFLATNGGHGTGVNYGKVHGIDVNLANFNSVSIDVAQNRITVGAGVKIADVITPLYNVGKAIPHGNSECVGLIGATIGAGIGVTTGLYGLGIDALEGVRMVTATGDIVTASTTINPELFWAIRGAGANFGIITSATFKLFNQTNNGNAVLGSFTYAPSANRSVFELLKSYDDNLPGELSLQLALAFNATTNTPTITLVYYYFGTLADAQPYLNAAAAIGPIATSITTVTQPALFGALAATCASGALISGATAGLGQTDVPTFQSFFAEFAAFSAANPGYSGHSIFQRYSNTVTLKTPLSSAVFPWRDIKTFWLQENIYLDPALEVPVANLTSSLRAKLEATSGFPTPHIYINYALGDEGRAAWWSAKNLPKLLLLKALWDPRSLFGAGNPIF